MLIILNRLIMVALCNRADHYIFALWFLSSSFFSSQIGCLPYFYTWRGPSANLECRSEMCCSWLTSNTGRKKVAKKIVIWAPSHNFDGLYLRF